MPSLFSHFVSANARVLRLFTPRRSPKAFLVESKVRILCLTKGGVSEMIDLLPLLNGLRRHYKRALIAVACDLDVAPIVQACKAVNVVLVYRDHRFAWIAALKNAIRFQNFDWVIAATPRVDRRLAALTRLTNTEIRIGFEAGPPLSHDYFTDPVALPTDLGDEHRIETLMRLMKPLGMVKSVGWGVDFTLRLPHAALASAEEIRSGHPFTSYSSFILINLTSALREKFSEEDFIALIRKILGVTTFAIGLIAGPIEVQIAREIVVCIGSDRVTVLETMSPIELAALLKHAAFVITAQDDAAHLAAAVNTPALVLWLKGPFKKIRSRGRGQIFVHAEPGEKAVPVERVWLAMQSLLVSKKADVEKQWADMQELPPPRDFMS